MFFCFYLSCWKLKVSNFSQQMWLLKVDVVHQKSYQNTLYLQGWEMKVFLPLHCCWYWDTVMLVSSHQFTVLLFNVMVGHWLQLHTSWAWPDTTHSTMPPQNIMHYHECMISPFIPGKICGSICNFKMKLMLGSYNSLWIYLGFKIKTEFYKMKLYVTLSYKC